MNSLKWMSLAVAILLLSGAAGAQDCVKTVRWFDDAPYSFRGTDGVIQGISVDLSRIVLTQMGCQVKWVEMPWARALLELEQGRLDVLPGALRKPERDAFAHFSRPFNRSPNVLFMHPSAAEKYRPKQLSDLAGTDFRLGAQIGVSYGPGYEALMKNTGFKSRVTPITLRRGAWQMIEKNRIDGLIADEMTGLLELQQLGLSHLVAKTRILVSGEPALVAFSKKSVDANFVARFNAVFSELLEDGRYKDTLQKYLPCPVSVEKLGCK